MKDLISWDIYEITTKTTPIHGVKMRGRIRKFALVNSINLLTENASDMDNVVRFALEHGNKPDDVIVFIKKLIKDAEIILVGSQINNPVLSKIKVNKEDRYEI